MFDALLRHWPLKLLALAIAFAIWVGVAGENLAVQDFRVPLELGLRGDAIVTGEPPKSVMVRLRGPEPLLQRVDSLGMLAQVDLRDSPFGERSVQLARSQIRGVPAGLEVASIEPDRLRVAIDRRGAQSVSVSPTIEGRPEAGYHYYGSIVTPQSLQVEGPRSAVERLNRLRTDPIPLEGHYSPFTVRVGATLDQRDVRLVDAS